MTPIAQLLIEACTVAILLALLTGFLYKVLPENTGMWTGVLLTGFLFHLLSEVSGLNAYYIKLHCKV